MIPVKICGITNIEDAQAAVNYSASALGFIFYDKSPRYISPELASQIAADLKGQVALVGVFVDAPLNYVHAIANKVGLNFIQLHGSESFKYCQKVQLPVIKVFRVADHFDAVTINNYDVHAYLFDTYEKNNPGGTGKIFNWKVIGNLRTDTPVILSGGLSTENILKSIVEVCPSAVDINSGVESKPGVKDGKMMKALFDILVKTSGFVNPFDMPVGQEGT